jgi:hypothetical protein
MQEKKSGTASPHAKPNVPRVDVNRLQFEAIEGHSITLDLGARRHLPVLSCRYNKKGTG